MYSSSLYWTLEEEMHLCDSPPLHSWLWKTSHHKHSKHVALFFPSSLQRKSSSLSSKCVVSTPACTQKQWTRPGSGHWGAAKSKAASCCWHQLLIWFVRGWADWEHKQREEITETKKRQKETANWDESTAAWGNKSSLCSNNRIIKRENRSLNIVLHESTVRKC